MTDRAKVISLRGKNEGLKNKNGKTKQKTTSKNLKINKITVETLSIQLQPSNTHTQQ